MEGPFIITRNAWKRTPLERIIEAIGGANHQIMIEEEKLNSLIDISERSIQQSKITDLKETVIALEDEKVKRQKRVKQLKKNRAILITKIDYIRKKSNIIHGERHSQRKIENLIKQIKLIDDDLGPFRHYDEPFFLE